MLSSPSVAWLMALMMSTTDLAFLPRLSIMVVCLAWFLSDAGADPSPWMASYTRTASSERDRCFRMSRRAWSSSLGSYICGRKNWRTLTTHNDKSQTKRPRKLGAHPQVLQAGTSTARLALALGAGFPAEGAARAMRAMQKARSGMKTT